MKIEWIEKIDSDGMHNAFTGMARFDGRYYLAYRKAKGHITPEAAQIVMSGEDGIKWRKTLETNFKGKEGGTVDYRDSFFMTVDDELRLYSCATPVDKEGRRGTSYTMLQTLHIGFDDWSAPEIIERNAIVWKPLKAGSMFYGAAYSKIDTHHINLHTSPDGIHWRKGPHIADGSETCLYAPEKNCLIAFVRTEIPPYHLEIYDSAAPFDEWRKLREIPKIIQCPHLMEMNGKLYILGRERPDYMMTADSENPSFSRHRTKIWEFKNNTLEEVLELPSSGDNAYTGTAMMSDGSLLVSYYSQHENNQADEWRSEASADIFVTKVNFLPE